MADSLSDRWAVAFANFIIRYRWFVIILTVAAVMGAASGARHLEFANNYRVFFGADNPELINFERFRTNRSVIKASSSSIAPPISTAPPCFLTPKFWMRTTNGSICRH